MDELSYVEDYAPQPLADPLAFLNEQPLPSILAPPALATTQQQSFSQQESVIPSGNERLGGEQMVTGAGVEIPATETSESWGGTAAFSSANQYTFGSNDAFAFQFSRPWTPTPTLPTSFDPSQYLPLHPFDLPWSSPTSPPPSQPHLLSPQTGTFSSDLSLLEALPDDWFSPLGDLSLQHQHQYQYQYHHQQESRDEGQARDWREQVLGEEVSAGEGSAVVGSGQVESSGGSRRAPSLADWKGVAEGRTTAVVDAFSGPAHVGPSSPASTSSTLDAFPFSSPPPSPRPSPPPPPSTGSTLSHPAASPLPLPSRSCSPSPLPLPSASPPSPPPPPQGSPPLPQDGTVSNGVDQDASSDHVGAPSRAAPSPRLSSTVCYFCNVMNRPLELLRVSGWLVRLACRKCVVKEATEVEKIRIERTGIKIDDLSVHLLITRVCSICELVDIYGNSGFVKSRCDACYTHLQTYKADKTLSELRNKRLMRSGVDIESWLAGQACEICDTTEHALSRAYIDRKIRCKDCRCHWRSTGRDLTPDEVTELRGKRFFCSKPATTTDPFLQTVDPALRDVGRPSALSRSEPYLHPPPQREGEELTATLQGILEDPAIPLSSIPLSLPPPLFPPSAEPLPLLSAWELAARCSLKRSPHEASTSDESDIEPTAKKTKRERKRQASHSHLPASAASSTLQPTTSRKRKSTTEPSPPRKAPTKKPKPRSTKPKRHPYLWDDTPLSLTPLNLPGIDFPQVYKPRLTGKQISESSVGPWLQHLDSLVFNGGDLRFPKHLAWTMQDLAYDGICDLLARCVTEGFEEFDRLARKRREEDDEWEWWVDAVMTVRKLQGTAAPTDVVGHYWTIFVQEEVLEEAQAHLASARSAEAATPPLGPDLSSSAPTHDVSSTAALPPSDPNPPNPLSPLATSSSSTTNAPFPATSPPSSSSPATTSPSRTPITSSPSSSNKSGKALGAGYSGTVGTRLCFRRFTSKYVDVIEEDLVRTGYPETTRTEIFKAAKAGARGDYARTPEHICAVHCAKMSTSVEDFWRRWDQAFGEKKDDLDEGEQRKMAEIYRLVAINGLVFAGSLNLFVGRHANGELVPTHCVAKAPYAFALRAGASILEDCTAREMGQLKGRPDFNKVDELVKTEVIKDFPELEEALSKIKIGLQTNEQPPLEGGWPGWVRRKPMDAYQFEQHLQRKRLAQAEDVDAFDNAILAINAKLPAALRNNPTLGSFRALSQPAPSTPSDIDETIGELHDPMAKEVNACLRAVQSLSGGILNPSKPNKPLAFSTPVRRSILRPSKFDGKRTPQTPRVRRLGPATTRKKKKRDKKEIDTESSSPQTPPRLAPVRVSRPSSTSTTPSSRPKLPRFHLDSKGNAVSVSAISKTADDHIEREEDEEDEEDEEEEDYEEVSDEETELERDSCDVAKSGLEEIWEYGEEEEEEEEEGSGGDSDSDEDSDQEDDPESDDAAMFMTSRPFPVSSSINSQRSPRIEEDESQDEFDGHAEHGSEKLANAFTEYDNDNGDSLMDTPSKPLLFEMEQHSDDGSCDMDLDTGASDEEPSMMEATGASSQGTRDVLSVLVVRPRELIVSLPARQLARRGEHLGFIIDACIGQVYVLATHRYGTPVLRRIFEICSSSQTESLHDELHLSFDLLLPHHYGNYVIQAFIENCEGNDRSRIFSKIIGQVLPLSQHRFGSGIVQKFIAYADNEERRKLIDEVLRPASDGPSVLRAMLASNFAEHVMQEMLKTARGEQRAILFEETSIHLARLVKVKRLTIEKLLAERRDFSNTRSNSSLPLVYV